MTTIVVTRKNNQIAIAADSQTTFGDTRLTAEFDRAANKIFQFGESFMAVSGSAAHDLVLQNALNQLKRPDLSGRVAIFETFRRLHPMLKDEYFLKTEEEEDDPYESSQMTVLIANTSGIFAVYSMREVYEYNRFWAIGTGRDYAIGAMHAMYDRVDSAKELARMGVEAGITFDVNSSLPMNLYGCKLAAENLG